MCTAIHVSTITTTTMEYQPDKKEEELIYELIKMKDIDAYAVNLRCVRSYVYFHESKYYKKIVDQILEHTEGKWEEAVRWWISNSARALKHNATGFVFSLDKESYTRNKQGIGYRKVKSLLDFLESKGYIDVYKGYVKSWKIVGGKPIPEDVVPSCLKLRMRTMDMWKDVNVSYNLWKEFEENDLAIIRNRETKELLPSRGHKGFKEIKKGVRNMNDSLEGACITFDDKPIADVAYRRIFTDDMSKGGRLYTMGGGVQLLPQHVRASSLKIDGESVVELDYSAIHPSICYQMMYNNDGFSIYDVMGKDFSPYNADMSFIKVDGKLKDQWESVTGQEHNPVRALAKLAILIGMNSNDINSAAWTLGNKVKQDRAKPNIEDQDFYAMVGSNDYGKVLLAVREHNDFIRDQFFSDAGIMLQNIDSKIMMSIIGAMGEKGHAVLAYHDSVLVKESAEQDLYDAMINAWETVLGDTTFCKVDKK